MFAVRSTLIFFIILAFNHCFAQGYVLNGEIKGVENGWAFIRHRQTGIIDSARIEYGKFKVSGMVDKPEFCSFGLSANGTKDYYLSMFIEGGDFRIRLNKDSLNDTAISFKGSIVEDEFLEFQRQISSINRHHYPDATAEGKFAQTADGFALKHPKSYVSAFALTSYESNVSKLARIYDLLARDIQQSYFGRQIKEKIGKN